MLTLALAVALAAPALDVTAAPAVVPLTAPDGVKGLKASFYVAGAPDAVLETVWDVRRFRAIFPDIQALDVLAARGDTEVDARFSVDAVLAKVTYVLRRDLDRARRTVTWTSIGGDLKSVRGSWTVLGTEDPAVSQVIYTSFVDVGYIVPTGMVRDIALGKVAEMAGRVRAACAGPRG